MSVQQRFLSSTSLEAVLLAVLLPGVASGCAHDRSDTEVPSAEASETEVALLRRENAALRNRVQNLEERVRMIEQGRMAGGSTSLGTTGYDSYSVAPDPDAWAEASDDGPRELPVVKLTPDAGSGSRQPASKPAPKSGRSSASISLSPVPNSGVDEYSGGYVDAREGDESGEAYADESPSGEPAASYRLVGSRLVQATQRKPAVPTSKSSGDRDSSVSRDYKAAMAIYDEGRYAEAEQAFAAIVASHPNHDYADNALYWQGEAAYDQAHYADALAAFTKVVEKYGGGGKAPDALLKIGLCYGRLGDSANARDVLSQLVAAYPRAEASKIAKRKLADLED